MKFKHLAMGAAVIGAAYLAFFGDKTPNQLTEAVVRDSDAKPTPTFITAPKTTGSVAVAPTVNLSRGHAQHVPIIIPALLPRKGLLGSATLGEHIKPALFASQTWTPAPSPALPESHTTQTAPPLPFTFIGKKKEDAIWEVYLLRDDHTFIVKKDTVLDNTYRVEAIEPPTLTLVYLPLKQMQTLTIGGVD